MAWNSNSQDGSGFGVFGQRFDFGGGSTIHVGDLDRREVSVVVSDSVPSLTFTVTKTARLTRKADLVC